MAHMIRWNPVRDLIQLREAMDRAFEDTYTRREARNVWSLPIDAYVTDDAIVLNADLPGLKPEDLEITLVGDTLTLRGEFKNGENKQNFLLRERMSGRFERVLTINTPIDSAHIEATFENGVLTLTLPKAEAAKPKQIHVKAGKN